MVDYIKTICSIFLKLAVIIRYIMRYLNINFLRDWSSIYKVVFWMKCYNFVINSSYKLWNIAYKLIIWQILTLSRWMLRCYWKTWLFVCLRHRSRVSILHWPMTELQFVQRVQGFWHRIGKIWQGLNAHYSKTTCLISFKLRAFLPCITH